MPRNTGLIGFGLTTVIAFIGVWRAEERNPPRSLESVVALGGSLLRDVQTPMRIALDVTVTPEEEWEVGSRLATPYLRRAVTGTAENRRLDRIGARVSAEVDSPLPYRFTLLPDVGAHAFAICGGQVFVTQGMMELCETDAELAGVIGHEVAHIDLRHTADAVWKQRLEGPERLLGVAEGMMRLAYSEELERRADQHGVRLAERAGYLPTGVLDLFVRLSDEVRPRRRRDTAATVIGSGLDAYLATHPPFAQRIATIEQLIVENRSAWRAKRYRINENEYGTL